LQSTDAPISSYPGQPQTREPCPPVSGKRPGRAGFSPQDVPIYACINAWRCSIAKPFSSTPTSTTHARHRHQRLQAAQDSRG